MGIQLPVRLTRRGHRRQDTPAAGGPTAGRRACRRSDSGIKQVQVDEDRGMVTVEIALAVPLLLLCAVVGAWLLAAGQLQARLTDAARATARELARGDAPGEAIAAGRRVVPDADIVVQRDDEVIQVVARQAIEAPGPVLFWLHRPLTATAITQREQVDW